MSLLAHIIRTDLRRLRWPLLGWVLLLALTPAMGWLLVATDVGIGRWFSTIVMWRGGLLFVEFAVGLMIVPLVVHGDPVVGSSAFWMSRPISPARLWWAKIGTLTVIFGALPVLVLLPWWLFCAYGATEIALAAVETLAWQSLTVALALPIATLTNSYTRYFMWLLVVLAAAYTAAVFWLVIPEYSTRTAYDLVYVWTRGWLALALFLLGGVGVAFWQFRTRRFSLSIVLFGFTATAAVATLGYWPRRFTPAPPAEVEVTPGPLAEQIGLSFDTARVLRTSEQNADVQVSLRFHGVPDNRILTEVWDITREGRLPAQHTWKWQGGLQLERSGWLSQGTQRQHADWVALGLPRPPPDPTEAIASANERRRKAGFAPINRPTDGRWGELRVQVPRAFPARVETEAPSYRVRLHLSVVRPELVGECPLVIGETLRIGSTIARVKSVNFERAAPDRTPLLIESAPNLITQGGQWNLVPMLRTGLLTPRTYYIVNRARGNAIAVGTSGSSIWGRFGSVRISRREISRVAPSEWTNGEWVQQQDWFRGLTLAAVDHTPEERFFKEVSVDRFTLTADSNAKATP